MDINSVLKQAIESKSSDIFVIPGLPLTYKNNGKQDRKIDDGKLSAADTSKIIEGIYVLAGRDSSRIKPERADDDFSFAISDIGRFRVNIFHQRGSLAAVIRVIQFGIPSPEALGIPSEVMNVTKYRKGIVLVTGQAGSGKSTTLACILDNINHTRTGHIITLEDPIEYVHNHGQCIVSQREVYSDCESYETALRSALRESPDVILVGEMRDTETIDVAMTAAETGQLLFSSLHTTGAANTIDRVIDAFPAEQQRQIRLQMSMQLMAVVSQQLVPDMSGKLIPVFEIMHVNTAIRNLIRESKTHQIDAAIEAGSSVGMRTMDDALVQLYRNGKISKDTAFTYCLHHDSMARKLGN